VHRLPRKIIKNIFSEGEISQESVIKEFLITASDGKQYRTQLYRMEERTCCLRCGIVRPCFCRRIRGSMCCFCLPHAHAWGYMLPPLRGCFSRRNNREAVAAYSPTRERGVNKSNTLSRECGDRNRDVLFRILGKK
jgi:hypothetical protein